jgi:hypothetical protein
LVNDQSSCSHTPYFGIVSGKSKVPTPSSYCCVIGVSAARFQVSTLNGSGKIDVMLAGQPRPPRAVMTPHYIRSSSWCRSGPEDNSPPIFTS